MVEPDSMNGNAAEQNDIADSSKRPIPSAVASDPPDQEKDSHGTKETPKQSVSSDTAVQLKSQTQSAKDQSTQSRTRSLETTLADLTAERNALAAQFSQLKSDRLSRESKQDGSEQDVDNAVVAAKAAVKEHISLLHRYNEIRDVALGLMGMIADQRGVRLREVQEEFGMDVAD